MKPNLPTLIFKNEYINNNRNKTNELLLNKDTIIAWQVKARPELGTAQPQHVFMCFTENSENQESSG